jgi:hypothetical protein
MKLRSSLCVAFAASCLGLAVSHVADAATASDVQTIALTRVFPAPGAIALVVANADGTDEHPLLGGAVPERVRLRKLMSVSVRQCLLSIRPLAFRRHFPQPDPFCCSSVSCESVLFSGVRN